MKLFKSKLAEYSWRGRVILAAVILAIVAVCFVAETVGFTDRLLLWTGVNVQKSVPLEGEIQVHVLDVGNADAIAVFCDGRAMLIDAGEYDDGERVADFLKEYGVTHLDYVVSTHPDADHIGGMQEVLRHVSVGEYLTTPMTSGEEPQTQTYTDLMTDLAKRRIKVTRAHVGMVRTLGTAELTVLSAGDVSKDTNDRSLVCRVDYQHNRFLFMGDAGYAVEEEISSEDANTDFLKVAHHGGNDATSETFLEKVTPSVAVISCGVDNAYKHPHKEVLDRLLNFQTTVYRTDYQGTVTVVGNGKTLTVTPEKE